MDKLKQSMEKMTEHVADSTKKIINRLSLLAEKSEVFKICSIIIKWNNFDS